MLNLETIKQFPSPNFRPRYAADVRYIVIHAALGTFPGTIARFQDKRSQVSAHFMVDRDGTIGQFVDLKNEAWHVCNANPFCIGIEHTDMWNIPSQRALQGGCMSGRPWWTESQLEQSSKLTAHLLNLYKLPIENVIGHNNPILRAYGNNHNDPGPMFPWPQYLRLVREELAAYAPKPVPAPLPPAPAAPPSKDTQAPKMAPENHSAELTPAPRVVPQTPRFPTPRKRKF